MKTLSRASSAVLLACLSTVVACPSKTNTASSVRPDPKLDPKAVCGQPDPLVVEWDATSRGRIESLRAKGLIAVRYEGCELQVLDCHATGKYLYVGLTPKDQRVAMRDRDELYANVPVGAASLEAKLQSKGELDADLRIVGRYEFERSAVRADELTGDCERATHVISAMSLGAFTFSAGGAATVGGGAKAMGAGVSGTSASSRETISSDGDLASCASSKSGDENPPFGCGALLRIELTPVELSVEERCARAGTRLVSCGVRFNPGWMAVCPKIASFNSCAKAAGNDCNALSLCVTKGAGAACMPAGTHTCKETADCYHACMSGSAIDQCACACSAGMSPDRALALTKHNACWLVFCKGKSGQASSDCFMKHCQKDAAECWAN